MTQFDKGLNVSHGNRGKWKEILFLVTSFTSTSTERMNVGGKPNHGD